LPPSPHRNCTIKMPEMEQFERDKDRVAKFFTNILAKPLRKVYDYPKIRLKRLHPYL